MVLRTPPTPPGLERLEALPRITGDVAANWPEYLEALQDPFLYAAVAGCGVVGVGAVVGARAGGQG